VPRAKRVVASKCVDCGDTVNIVCNSCNTCEQCCDCDCGCFDQGNFSRDELGLDPEEDQGA